MPGSCSIVACATCAGGAALWRGAPAAYDVITFEACLTAVLSWHVEYVQEGQPCGGERLLLMFDRWRKLGKAFYSEKREQFDISKVRVTMHVMCILLSATLSDRTSSAMHPLAVLCCVAIPYSNLVARLGSRAVVVTRLSCRCCGWRLSCKALSW